MVIRPVTLRNLFGLNFPQELPVHIYSDTSERRRLFLLSENAGQLLKQSDDCRCRRWPPAVIHVRQRILGVSIVLIRGRPVCGIPA